MADYAPALIDKDTWDIVQRRLQQDSQSYKSRRTANTARQYLLSGMIRCASCGGSFSIGIHRDGVPHYRCTFHARGSSVCANPVVVSQKGVEARVAAMMEVVVKDPRQLEVLVAEHNRRISSTNDQQTAVVRTLQARQATLKEEVDNLVAAIAKGKGNAKALVEAIESKEAELDGLKTKIAEADALVQPLLLPRRAAVTDYVAGSASLFTGDFLHDRQLVERVVDKILVYASGALVVQFREASLFHPIRFAQLGSAGEGSLDRRRRETAEEYGRQKVEVARAVGATAAENLEVDALVDETGRPAYVMFTPGSVQRTFGPGKFAATLAARPKDRNEIASVSPGGIYPLGSRAGVLTPVMKIAA